MSGSPKQLQKHKGSAIVTVAAVIVIVYGMQMAKVLLVPFLIAVFLALITARPMLWLHQLKLNGSQVAIGNINRQVIDPAMRRVPSPSVISQCTGVGSVNADARSLAKA